MPPLARSRLASISIPAHFHQTPQEATQKHKGSKDTQAQTALLLKTLMLVHELVTHRSPALLLMLASGVSLAVIYTQVPPSNTHLLGTYNFGIFVISFLFFVWGLCSWILNNWRRGWWIAVCCSVALYLHLQRVNNAWLVLVAAAALVSLAEVFGVLVAYVGRRR